MRVTARVAMVGMLAVLVVAAVLLAILPAHASPRPASRLRFPVRVTVIWRRGQVLTARCHRHTRTSRADIYSSCIDRRVMLSRRLPHAQTHVFFSITWENGSRAAQGWAVSTTHTGPPGARHYFEHNATMGPAQ